MANGKQRGFTPATTAVLIAAVLSTVLAGGDAGVAAVATPTPNESSPTATPVPPGAIQIEVVLLSGKKRLAGEDSIAWLPEFKARPEMGSHLKIAQNKKQFQPRLAVVSVGSTVDFPNFDKVFHNVFSLSTAKSFDLGLYRRGKSKSIQFDRPGLVQIYCNIHPHMSAYLMIVDSRRHGVANGQGSISLRSIPAGRRSIEGWNVRGGLWKREVTVRSGRSEAITVEIDISNWREAQHLNKHGKEYPPPDDDDFRY